MIVKLSSYLSIEPIVVGVEEEVVEVKEARPVLACDGLRAAEDLVLVAHPYQHNDVERRRGVFEELGHDRLHS